MNDLISIIVPVYNREKCITRCLDSIINQLYKNIEIIVVDDGSTDNTYEVLLEYKIRDNRIRVLKKNNGGVSSARMYGLNNASGKYVGFVDSDDYIEKEMYLKLYSAICENESDMAVLYDYVVKKRDGNPESCITNDIALKKICMLEFPTSVWAGLYKKEIALQVGFDTNIHFFEDFYFNFQVLEKTDKVSIVNGHYYRYEKSDNSCNSSGLNWKRLSCLNVIPTLLEKTKKFDFLNTSIIGFTIAHFLICNILFLYPSNVNTYGFFLQKQCKKHVGSIALNGNVPISYKFLIFLCLISPKFTALLMKIRRTLR